MAVNAGRAAEACDQHDKGNYREGRRSHGREFCRRTIGSSIPHGHWLQPLAQLLRFFREKLESGEGRGEFDAGGKQHPVLEEAGP